MYVVFLCFRSRHILCLLNKKEINMSTGAFGYVNLLKSAADASWTREEVLTNNIANVDTPNYKRQDVEFSSYLANALQRSGKNSASLILQLLHHTHIE